MRVAASILSTLVAIGCSGSSSPVQSTPMTAPATATVPAAQPLRVLMLTATAGFRHDSIPAARSAVAAIAARSGGFVVTPTENLSDINASRLGSTDVLMFALTSGELAFD